MTRTDAGKLGGLARARKYTSEQLSAFIKTGNPGRPHLPTYEEIIASRPAVIELTPVQEFLAGVK